MIFERTVTYRLHAPSLEAAIELWDEDGPELADTRAITEVEFGSLVEMVDEQVPDGTYGGARK